jgi:glycosyltransferase involved in cell wall biosynthesis
VPSRDSDALATALIRIITDTALATLLKKNARKRFLDNFTEATMLEHVWQVYEQVAREKGLIKPK